MNQTSLNKGWKFQLGEEEEAWYRGYDDNDWRGVTLPHDWSVEHPFDQAYSSGTGYLRGGVGWYRLRFTLPEDIKGKTVQVTFGGVYQNSRVWCNSNYLGMRPSGYAGFTYDISSFAEPGENVLAVRAEHIHLADSRWFTGNGITRGVTLSIGQPLFFPQDEVFVSTEAANEAEALLRVQWKLSHTKESSQAEVLFTLRDAEGTEAATAAASGEEGITMLRVLHPALWSPDSPALYTLHCRAIWGGNVQDETEIVCGIRTIAFDADTGFALNGTSMKLKGVCLHHDAGALGAAVPKAVWRRRLEKLKAAGCNAIRTAHNPPDASLLELCDEMGFLAMDEAFDEWEGCKNKWWQGHNVYPPKRYGYSDAFPMWHEQDLSSMVRRDRNHPSIILWSIGNEIDYPNDPYCHPMFLTMTGNNDANKPAQERQYNPNKPNAERLAEIARTLTAIVKQHDTTRPVTSALAFPELSNPIGYAKALDVVGYNYKEHLYREDRVKYPGHVIYGSENGHGEAEWLAVRDHDDICGQFLWTGVDYLGEAHGWPVRLSPAGLLTTAGHEKPRYYHRKAMWSEGLVVRLAARAASASQEQDRFSWNFTPGQTVRVSVYTNARQAELFLNGRSLGTKALEGRYCTEFELPFEPGELRVVASRDTETAEDVLMTPGALAELRLSADRTVLGANGEDVAQVEVMLCDAAGQCIASGCDTVPLRFSAEGGCEIIGIENGAPDDLTPYPARERTAFMGRAIVYLRSAGRAEPALLHATAPNGLAASLVLSCQ